MHCPRCNRSHSKARVVETRPVEEGAVIRRRLVCPCGYRYTTAELDYHVYQGLKAYSENETERNDDT